MTRPKRDVRKRCRYCPHEAVLACDHVMPNGRRCDLALCGEHVYCDSDDRNLCPEHRGP